MSDVQVDYEAKLVEAIVAAAQAEQSNDDQPQVFGATEATSGLQAFEFGGRFTSLLEKVLANIDLTTLTKEQFLSAVSMAYDLLAPKGVPFLKPLVLMVAGQIYDRLTKPK